MVARTPPIVSGAQWAARHEAACPVCSQVRFVPDRRWEDLTFGHCSACQVAYVQPFPEQGRTGEASTVTADDYNRSLLDTWDAQVSACRAMLPGRLRAYERLLGRPPRSVLELGCGSGAWGAAYRGASVEYRGLDLNHDMVRFARRRGLEVAHADVVVSPLPEGSDVIFASQVLEHTLEPRRLLHNVRPSLAPGGVLHLDVPNHGGAIPGLKRALRLRPREHGFLQPPHHCIAYNARSMAALLERVGGFADIEITARSNLHRTWGQPIARGRPLTLLTRAVFHASAAMGGSLLVVFARRAA